MKNSKNLLALIFLFFGFLIINCEDPVAGSSQGENGDTGNLTATLYYLNDTYFCKLSLNLIEEIGGDPAEKKVTGTVKVIEGTNKGKTAEIDYAVAMYDENTFEIELMVKITKNEELQMEFFFIDNKFEECFWYWENLETGKESFGYGTVVKPK